MATLRALDGPEPLERFVELTKLIRTLEIERDGLKDQIVEALMEEPPDGPSGSQHVDYDGLRLELCFRAKWAYSADVKQAEADLRALKTSERANGNAEMQGGTSFVKCSTSRAGSEQEARERKANAIAAHLATSGLSVLDVEAWTQSRRDEAAQRAGQRSPSEKTWALILGKLERRKAA